MARDFGLTELGTLTDECIFASPRPPRTIDITVKSGEGILPAGTLLQKDSGTGIYQIYDYNDTKAIAGALGEEIDATDEAVKTTLLFDFDMNKANTYVGATSFSGVTNLVGVTSIDLTFDSASLINFKEGL